MDLRPERLRVAEVAAGLLGIALIVVLVAAAWYHAGALPQAGTPCRTAAPCAGSAISLTGWQSFSILRWAILVCALLALALTWTQMAFRAPALPVSIAVVLGAAGLVTAVWLLVRLIVSAPAAASTTAGGGWIELALLLATVAASVASLRLEGILERDGPGVVPVLDPAGRPAGERESHAAGGEGSPPAGPLGPPDGAPS